jgi:hypothetical protein
MRIWQLREVPWCRYSISGVLAPKGSITGRIVDPNQAFSLRCSRLQSHSRKAPKADSDAFVNVPTTDPDARDGGVFV